MLRSIARWMLLVAVVIGMPTSVAAQGEDKDALPHRELRMPKGFVEHAVFSPDGSLVAGGAGAVVVVWNLADGKEVQRLQLPEKQVYHRVAFSLDGKSLIWTGREDRMIRIFDVKTGKQVREFAAPQGLPRQISAHFLGYSPDGKRMAFNGAKFFKGVDILDVETSAIVLQLPAVEDCRGCAFSADGKLIATNSSMRGIHVWDAVTGELVREIRATERGAGAAWTLASFSHDGKFLATSGHLDNSLSVWSVKTGKLAAKLDGKAFFRTAFFSEDNLSLLVVSAHSTRAMLHNLVTERDVHVFHPPKRLVHWAGFSPDFKRVAVIGPSTDSDDSSIYGQFSIYLYDLPAKLLRPANAQIDDAPLEKLWPDLNTDNEFRLTLVLKAFRAAPKPTVELFAKKVPPVANELRAKVERAIADLDHDTFGIRDQAMTDLHTLAHAFAPLLEARLRDAPAGETRNRLTFVVKQMAAQPQPASLVMELRAVALLEQIGTSEARDLLDRLARGAPQARLTVEAQAAHGRLNSGLKGAPK